MIFAAKVDLWFLVLFYGLGGIMIVGAPWIRRRSGGRFAAFLPLLVGILFIGVGWSASSVRYIVTADGYLDARGWPYGGRIAPISAIRQVEFSHDPRASHAASLDRLRIDHGNNGLIFIAVQDEDGFLDALASRDPDLRRSSTGLHRRPRESPRFESPGDHEVP